LAEQALLDLGHLPEAQADALLEHVETQGRPQDVEREVHALALPPRVEGEEQQAPVGPSAHDHPGRWPLGEDPERGRRIELVGIGEDVHAMAQDQAHGGPGGLEEIRGAPTPSPTLVRSPNPSRRSPYTSTPRRRSSSFRVWKASSMKSSGAWPPARWRCRR